MKKQILFLPLLIFIFSCSGNKNDSVKKEDKEALSIEDMPDKDTAYDTIKTQNTEGHQKLINDLGVELQKAGFSFEMRKNQNRSFNNCEENRVKVIAGNGIREYFAKSHKPEKGTKDFYPDFVIRVYEFKSEADAERNFKELNTALYSRGRHCNGKAPEKLVINGREIYDLSTRAEMFRAYIEKYSKVIEDYH
ncbi:hypothetical protein B0A69_21890 [Chryseobacterium shigense]|uniref:Lipoprotein n=1 Tax=Chryseobacterium shigense TaxID=297244 RepID=A0A1N7KG00_9FLAO|nr:hypothetical protein [Chryseobacterium shigense]PQA89875.1 hypothetical protein B0A69_21890 [Chryseobacterium shigense]SIS60521.1 hypothetical protein SAMN05421639_11028 [Chryseobacterium shigense]